MYQGPYKPKYYQEYKPPHENFTVTVPPGFPKGHAQLNVAHFALVGVRQLHRLAHAFNLFVIQAGPFPWLELHNKTLIVA